MATIITIEVPQKTITPKYNPYQTGTGVWQSEKYKKKGRRAEKDRKEMKKYED